MVKYRIGPLAGRFASEPCRLAMVRRCVFEGGCDDEPNDVVMSASTSVHVEDREYCCHGFVGAGGRWFGGWCYVAGKYAESWLFSDLSRTLPYH